MSRSKLLAILIIVAALGVAVFFYLSKDSSPDTQNSSESSGENSATEQNASSQPSSSEQSSPADSQTFTKAEVAKHNTKTDCWTIIDDKVYNLTPYIEDHPGGDEIFRACGIDGTTLFTERQTEDEQEVGTGTPHSSEAEKRLQSLFVGTLSD